MISNMKSRRNFAVLEAFCHESDNVFLSSHQHRPSFLILELQGLEMNKSVENMFKIYAPTSVEPARLFRP